MYKTGAVYDHGDYEFEKTRLRVVFLKSCIRLFVNCGLIDLTIDFLLNSLSILKKHSLLRKK